MSVCPPGVGLEGSDAGGGASHSTWAALIGLAFSFMVRLGPAALMPVLLWELLLAISVLSVPVRMAFPGARLLRWLARTTMFLRHPHERTSSQALHQF